MTPAKFTKLLDQMEKAESDMLRALRKWDKLRQRVRRANKALDAQFTKRANDIAGAHHIDDFAELTGIKKDDTHTRKR